MIRLLAIIWVIPATGLSAQFPSGERDSSVTRGVCECAPIACAFALQSRGLSLSEHQLDAIRQGASVSSLSAIRDVLSKLGIESEVQRLTPERLVQLAKLAIVPIKHVRYTDHQHVETYVGAGPTQAVFAAPSPFNRGGSIVVRSFDNLAGVWDGEALVLNPTGHPTDKERSILMICVVAVGSGVVGWLLGQTISQVRRARVVRSRGL